MWHVRAPCTSARHGCTRTYHGEDKSRSLPNKCDSSGKENLDGYPQYKHFPPYTSIYKKSDPAVGNCHTRKDVKNLSTITTGSGSMMVMIHPMPQDLVFISSNRIGPLRWRLTPITLSAWGDADCENVGCGPAVQEKANRRCKPIGFSKHFESPYGVIPRRTKFLK